MKTFKQLKVNLEASIDNKTWGVPSIKLAENKWLVCWKKTEDYVESTTEQTFIKSSFVKKGQKVFHNLYGEGNVSKVDKFYIGVDFGFPIREKQLEKSEILVAKPKLIRQKLETPVSRFFYIDGNKITNMVMEDSELKIVFERKGDLETINEILVAFSKQDDMYPLLRTDASWRATAASPKQMELLTKLGMKPAKNITKGEASSLMDLNKNMKLINEYFY